jgi:hypothetical protein
MEPHRPVFSQVVSIGKREYKEYGRREDPSYRTYFAEQLGGFPPGRKRDDHLGKAPDGKTGAQCHAYTLQGYPLSRAENPEHETAVEQEQGEVKSGLEVVRHGTASAVNGTFVWSETMSLL